MYTFRFLQRRSYVRTRRPSLISNARVSLLHSFRSASWNVVSSLSLICALRVLETVEESILPTRDLGPAMGPGPTTVPTGVAGGGVACMYLGTGVSYRYLILWIMCFFSVSSSVSSPSNRHHTALQHSTQRPPTTAPTATDPPHHATAPLLVVRHARKDTTSRPTCTSDTTSSWQRWTNSEASLNLP